jgi:hypothetical protein
MGDTENASRLDVESCSTALSFLFRFDLTAPLTPSIFLDAALPRGLRGTHGRA